MRVLESEIDRRQFQSTLSVRRATRSARSSPGTHAAFQSTLSVRRATDVVVSSDLVHGISIHALRKESDLLELAAVGEVSISIHALRKESDLTDPVVDRGHDRDFNPRSP